MPSATATHTIHQISIRYPLNVHHATPPYHLHRITPRDADAVYGFHHRSREINNPIPSANLIVSIQTLPFSKDRSNLTV